MAAWVTKEWYEDGKRRRERVAAGMKGVCEADRYVIEWFDLSGKRCRQKIKGAGRPGKRLADERAQQLTSQLTLGTYENKTLNTWAEFRRQYEKKILEGMDVGSKRCTMDAMNHYERINKPKKMTAINSEAVDDYVAKRRKERGKKCGSAVSKATINKELRHLRAIFRKAQLWGYVKIAPQITFLTEDQKVVRYVTPEHFAEIYAACKIAKRPKHQHYSAATWWRALLVFDYMTGWRISEPMTLQKDQLDLDAAEAVLRASDTKGRRGERVPLHSLVVEHLREIVSFDPLVFTWPHAESTLYKDFGRIQTEAGIHLPCHEQHEHTKACHRYGFHDLRRAFATMNAETLTADALQALMRHKSYTTTQRYINIAKQLTRSVEQLHVPKLPKISDVG